MIHADLIDLHESLKLGNFLRLESEKYGRRSQIQNERGGLSTMTRGGRMNIMRVVWTMLRSICKPLAYSQQGT